MPDTMTDKAKVTLGFQMAEGFAPVLNQLIEEGHDHSPALAESFVDQLSYETLAHLLLQFPLTEADPGTLGGVPGPDDRPNRQFALDVADILGPEHAQALYRFAVLVTKLAR